MESEYDLSQFDDFARAVAMLHPRLRSAKMINWATRRDYYCVKCGDKRRMTIWRLYWDGERQPAVDITEPPTPLFQGPSLFRMTCVQCGTTHAALVHEGPDGWELAIFSKERGGFATLHTPDSVSYYLDQAHRAESVGATSAAAGMYRSALEMLLYEQGYTSGLLGKKISNLLSDPTPPDWRDQIHPDYLDALQKIGNGAVHPNDGDVKRQQVLDRELLGLLRAVFEEILDVIYERPNQRGNPSGQARDRGKLVHGSHDSADIDYLKASQQCPSVAATVA